jgi:gamma-glutamyltranspeptidase
MAPGTGVILKNEMDDLTVKEGGSQLVRADRLQR